MAETDEFVLAESSHAQAAERRHRPLPIGRRASTWGAVGAALILLGVLVTPGPLYPPLGEGIEWNVLEMDLATEPDVAWVAEIDRAHLLGERDGVIVLMQEGDLWDEAEELPARTMIGLDQGTGSELWRIEDEWRTCQLGSGSITCTADPTAAGAAVIVHDLDSITTQPTVIPYPGAISATTLDDGGMLVIEGGTEALAELVRRDADGGELWSVALSFSGLADSSHAHIELLESGVAVTSGGTFDIETGEPSQGFSGVDAEGTIRTLTDRWATAVTFADGSEVLVPPGEAWLEVDDAFGGPVSLQWGAAGDVTVRWDGGEHTHALFDSGCWLLMRLQGALVHACPDADGENGHIVAVDQKTGEELWRRPSGTSGGRTASADTIVLTSAGTVEGADPRTGESRWSIPVPGERPGVTAIGDVLIVVTSEALLLLG